MAYSYHFYGFWQIAPGELNHIDGTVDRDSMITSKDEYDEVKKAIAVHFKVPGEKFTLASLTLLNPST